jgi:Ca2+-binding RTX toxin-like protein
LRSGSRTIGITAVTSVSTSEGKTELLLELNETLPADTVVKLTYLGDKITDTLGNKLSQFNGRIVTHLSSDQTIDPPSYAYERLELTGSSNANASGNAYNNQIVGNTGDNILNGGYGADSITGGAGRDTFVFSSARDSMLRDPVTGLLAIDRITDLAIGTDIIQSWAPVASSEILRLSKPDQQVLTADALTNWLSEEQSPSFKAALVSINNSSQTFLVLNDDRAGFNPSNDSVIDITGYSGLLENLRII